MLHGVGLVEFASGTMQLAAAAVPPGAAYRVTAEALAAASRLTAHAMAAALVATDASLTTLRAAIKASNP
jgi:hypothetical protein